MNRSTTALLVIIGGVVAAWICTCSIRSEADSEGSDMIPRHVAPLTGNAVAEPERTAIGLAVIEPARNDATDSSDEGRTPEDLSDIADETDPMRVRWRVLRYGLQDYRSLASKTPHGSRESTLVCDSVATILELSGRGQDPDWSRTAAPGQYYMVSGGRGYSWSVGEFPEYDAWRAYMLSMGDARAQPSTERSASAPSFDAANFDRIEERAAEAIALLEDRFGFEAGADR